MTKSVGLMVYGNVRVKGSPIASPEEIEEDKKWLKKNKIKAFRAVSSGMLPSRSPSHLYRAVFINDNINSKIIIFEGAYNS